MAEPRHTNNLMMPRACGQALALQHVTPVLSTALAAMAPPAQLLQGLPAAAADGAQQADVDGCRKRQLSGGAVAAEPAGGLRIAAVVWQNQTPDAPITARKQRLRMDSISKRSGVNDCRQWQTHARLGGAAAAESSGPAGDAEKCGGPCCVGRLRGAVALGTCGAALPTAARCGTDRLLPLPTHAESVVVRIPLVTSSGAKRRL
jgi:hypothetical protein